MLKSLTLENFRAFRRADIPLSVLNIFVGPNNSGKSSIISAISLIAQNLRPLSQQYSLALNGPHTQLGTFYDVVHGHSAKSTLTIGLSVDDFSYSYTFRYRPARREIELVKATISDKELELSYQRTKGRVVRLKSLSDGEFLTLGNARPRATGLTFFMPIQFSQEGKPTKHYTNQQRARRFINRSNIAMNDSFRFFDSIGAFRVAPERTYYYSGEAYANIGRNGENSAQILASSSSRQRTNILSRVSQWFSESGIAKDVRVKPLTKRHFEVLIEDATGSSNNITDSGFGCSQVLPVLVGGLQISSRGRRGMYVVQEPEIHLHPTAAAQLGTFFVDLAKKGIQCFVETHSENIVLRTARMVASGEIKADDVKVYWVSGNEGEHKLTDLKLRNDGTFEKKWPEGFFPTRGDEALELARASTRHTKSGS
jgi:predicted ATPase